MKPVIHIVKTAFILYSIFAGLLIMVTLGLPQTRTAFSPAAVNHKPDAIFKENRALIAKQREFKESWRQILEKEGYIPQAVYKLQTERLMERQAGSAKLQWIHSESTIVLPAARSKLKLVRLASQWQSLVHALGFDVNSTRWGYSHANLWVRFTSSVRAPLADHAIKLPLEQVTLIQPVTGFKGWLPGLVPSLPPELETMEMELPKMQSPPVAKIPTPKEPPVKKPLQPVAIKKRAQVAIIIDDVGYVTRPADEMLKVPAPLTWSVLPYGPYSQKYSQAAQERGFEILLHLPLEPLDRNTNPGPGLIKRDSPDEVIIDQLGKDLAQIPAAVGVNNHMGSAGTSDGRLMGILMEELKKRELFFVDSFTIASSVAEKYARLNKLPFAKRKVFIDNRNDLNDKKTALRSLIRIALRDGEAIGIAHVREGTAEAIREMLPEFAKAGIEIVPVSKLVK